MRSSPRHATTAAATLVDRPVIEFRDATGAVSRLPVTGDRLIIGRLDTANICLPSANVSRLHAELFRDEDHQWRLRDLDSHNGTWVGGARISECRVYWGQPFNIGEYELRILVDDDEPGSRGSEPGHLTLTRLHGERLTSLMDGAPPHVRCDHLTAVSKAGEQLLTIDDADERLAVLCRLMLQDPLPGRAAVALRLTETNPPQILIPAQHRRAGDDMPHVSQTLLDAVWSRRQPLMASNAAASEDAIELSIVGDRAMMSAAACPLSDIASSAYVDVLYVTMPPGYETTEWLALIALAVEQYRHAQVAWRHRREAQRIAIIEGELEQARRLQMQLVPRITPAMGLDIAICFEPCRAVGGDYVDVIDRLNGRLLLTVADVCGKGIHAAMTAYCLHTMMHGGVKANLTLPQIMTSINEYLLEILPPTSFVTMIAVEVDLASGAMAIINAGHPAPIIAGRDGECRMMEHAGYMPLGIDALGFAVTQRQLDAGETIALFSDGLSELPLSDGTQWGPDGIAAALRTAITAADPLCAAKIADALTRESEQLLADRLAPDDRTLLLARR